MFYAFLAHRHALDRLSSMAILRAELAGNGVVRVDKSSAVFAAVRLMCRPPPLLLTARTYQMAEQKSLHQKLSELSENLWWSWQPEVSEIFRQIDPPRWSELMHNPVVLLKEYDADKLEERATEMVLHSRVHAAYRRWRKYMEF